MRIWGWMSALVATALLAACGGGSDGQSAPPAQPSIASFDASKAAYLMGERAQLTPVYSGGSGRIEPGVGPVQSGVAIATPALEGDVTYRLIVEASGENWSSRSGTVKVNLALSELPRIAEKPGWTDFTGGFEIAPSLEQLETSFEEARHGRAATLPFSDGCIPTVLDPSLAPEGVHVMSLFAQCVPHTWSEEQPQDELEAYADRVVDAYERVAPGFKESILARQVIGPYEMEQEWGLIGGNIFLGELSANQLFHMRPAPGYADYRRRSRG